MPRAPYGTDLYNQGNQIPTQPGGGGDPRMNVGGAGVHIDDLAGLVDVPMLDTAGPIAMGRGAAAIGQGISEVGGSMMKLLEMQAEARKVKRINENERAMMAVEQQVAVEIENEPDEMKWGAIREKAYANLPELPEDLSEDAKDHITARRESWAFSHTNRITLASVRKSVTDADNEIAAIESNAVYNGDLETANRSTDERVRVGKITPAQGESQKIRNKVGVEQSQKRVMGESYDAGYNAMVAKADGGGTPDEIREIAKDPVITKGFDPETKHKLERDAESLIKEKEAAALDAALSNIWNPDPTKQTKTEDEIDGSADPFLQDPVLKKKVKAELAYRDEPGRKATLEHMAPYLSASIAVAIKGYDPVADEKENGGARPGEMALRQHIWRLPEGMRATLSQSLYSKLHPGKEPLDKDTFNSGDDVLQMAFNEGMFGQTKPAKAGGGLTGMAASQAEGGAAAAKVQWTAEDLTKYTGAKVLYARARDEWRLWVKDHPEAKFYDDATQKEFSAMKTRYHIEAAHVAPEPLSDAGLFPGGLMLPPQIEGGVDVVEDALSRYSSDGKPTKSANNRLDPDLPVKEDGGLPPLEIPADLNDDDDDKTVGGDSILLPP